MYVYLWRPRSGGGPRDFSRIAKKKVVKDLPNAKIAEVAKARSCEILLLNLVMSILQVPSFNKHLPILAKLLINTIRRRK